MLAIGIWVVVNRSYPVSDTGKLIVLFVSVVAVAAIMLFIIFNMALP